MTEQEPGGPQHVGIRRLVGLSVSIPVVSGGSRKEPILTHWATRGPGGQMQVVGSSLSSLLERQRNEFGAPRSSPPRPAHV